MKRIKRLIAMLVLVSILTVTMTSCCGNFALTRKVYRLTDKLAVRNGLELLYFGL